MILNGKGSSNWLFLNAVISSVLFVCLFVLLFVCIIVEQWRTTSSVS